MAKPGQEHEPETGQTVSPELIRAARRAAGRAYAPYSSFSVGAALLDVQGVVFLGANVENAAYPLGICAERVALQQWRQDRGGEIRQVVIYTRTVEPTPPCGLCREALCRWAPRADVFSRLPGWSIGPDHTPFLASFGLNPGGYDARAGRASWGHPGEDDEQLNAKALIRKTRDGEELSGGEIDFLVRGAVSGEVPSYQLTAWMMAVFLRGLTREETTALTLAMLRSGDRLAHRSAAFLPADKHSTGGVGDKISFLTGPLVAAAGVPVPMISGRSLGHTGGTLDKLESIPGFQTSLDAGTFLRNVEEVGLCIAGQSDRLAPADRILYQLRDAASIVESVPLITASILSKKASAGVRALVLDVKVGTGAFMADPVAARALAESLVSTAAQLGIRSRAHLTRMDRVLGRTAGNALEVAESLEALSGGRISADLRELTLDLAGSMLELAGAAPSAAVGARLIEGLWQSGAGRERFLLMVEKQGGDARALEDPKRGLPRAGNLLEVRSPRSGTFLGIQARAAGSWIAEAGGGRIRAGDRIDPRIGIEILAEPGTALRAEEPVFLLHLPEGGGPPELARDAAAWVLFGEPGAEPPSLRVETLESPA